MAKNILIILLAVVLEFSLLTFIGYYLKEKKVVSRPLIIELSTNLIAKKTNQPKLDLNRDNPLADQPVKPVKNNNLIPEAKTITPKTNVSVPSKSSPEKEIKKPKAVKKLVKKARPKQLKKVSPKKPLTPKKDIVPAKTAPVKTVETKNEPIAEDIAQNISSPKLESNENLSASAKKIDLNAVSENTIKAQSEKSLEQTSAKQNETNNKYLKRIFTIIARNKKYPSRARRRGIEGIVVVVFSISKNGKVVDLRITNKANQQLKKAAMETVKKGRFPFPPDTWDPSFQIEIPIKYSLK
jgi:protein TonB